MGVMIPTYYEVHMLMLFADFWDNRDQEVNPFAIRQPRDHNDIHFGTVGQPSVRSSNKATDMASKARSLLMV